LNICIVTPSLYPLSIGGPANVTSYLIRELNRCGFKLKIIFELPYAAKIDMQLLRNYLRIGEGSELIPLWLTSDWKSRIIATPSSLNLITKTLQEVDLIHFQTYPSAIPYFAMLPSIKSRHIPCVLSYHGPSFLKIRNPREARTLQEYFYIPYFFLTKNLFDAIIVPSFSMARRAELEGFEKKKIKIIPNGIDITRFQESKPITLEGDPAILWVGYTGWNKGVDIVLESMKIVLDNVPSARFHFVGPYHIGFIEELRRNKLDGILKIHGLKSPLEMPSYYLGADICINPSRWESFSLVVLETMAAGKPIIASRVGGMKELIHDGEDGLLARPEAKSFAEAILKICNDVDLRKRIERNAIKRAKMFLWSNIISDYLNLYNALVEK